MACRGRRFESAVDVSTEYPIMGASDCVSLLKKQAQPVIEADTGC